MTEGNAPAPPPAPPAKTAEDEDLPMGTIFAVAMTILAFFTLAVLFTGWLMKSTERAQNPAGPAAVGSAVGKQQIGMVEETLFERQRRAELLREQQRQQLHSYGWVSRQPPVIHLPIERAMELVAQGKRPGGAP